MAVNLSATAELLVSQRNLTPNIILEIDGVPEIYGALDIEKFCRYGEDGIFYGMEGLFYGGMIVDEHSRDYISLGSSSSQLTQQLIPDRGSTQSITTFDLDIIDRNQELTRLISPGIVLDEIIGVKCKCYLNFKGGAHPEDSILFHRGIISKVAALPASVKLTIASPERQKRQKVFVQAKTNLTSMAHYKSAIVQSIQYQQRTDYSGTVSIAYTSGATAGSEIVTVVGDAISVAIESGVSKASQIRNALEESAAAMARISLKILDGQSATVQVLQATVPMALDSTINVTSTEGFFLPSDSGTLESFIQIGDEVIQFTGMTSTSFTGCTRGSLDTVAELHDLGEDVTSFYKLEGSCIDLALKLMLSGGDQIWCTESVQQFNKISETESRRGVIFFNYYDITEKRGPVIGDFINITDSTSGNDVSMLPIIAMDKNEFGSWIEVDYDFNDELDSPAQCEFISKYNVLSDGLGMTPEDVDVARHEDLQTRFNSNLADYKFYLKDTINGEEFLPQQIYYPSGFYSLPRKSKSSISITVPPIADQNIVFLDEENVVKPSGLVPERSADQNFYNAVIYRYEKDVVEDKFLKGNTRYSADSQNRIKNFGNKPMVIDSDGLRDNGETDTLLRINSRRLLERYQFAAEKIPGVKVFGKVGFAIEVGDVVVFGSPDLQISDISRGSREFEPKLYEVQNKSLSIRDGSVSLDLLSTNFALDGRYSIIAPSTIVGVGSTTNRIKVIDSFSTTAPRKEKDKWRDYIGETIMVRNLDWTFVENTTLVKFSDTDDYQMEVDPPLSIPPTSGMIIEAPLYDQGTDQNVQATWKLLHAFLDPQVPIVVGNSTTSFDVAPGDVGKFFVGSVVRVHNFNYSVDSVERVVDSIVGNTINVDLSLGFVPTNLEVVDLIGFPDEGKPYRYI
jgi:hypothetical protein